jgi:hypothetical protein
MRTYSELLQYETLQERYEYLKLGGRVGEVTFGAERQLNQSFYRSREWRDARSEVRARDLGYDLGIKDFPIMKDPYVHHMNPITILDIEERSDNLFNPEFLITTSLGTHNAIHYGDESQLPRAFIEREPGDTRLWGEVGPIPHDRFSVR